jgi:predicted RND superfamily exporter protein
MSDVFWPSNSVSEWILAKATAKTPDGKFALGVLNLDTNRPSSSALAQLSSELSHEQVWLSGWDLLGAAIFARVKANLWKVLVPMVVLVLLSLWMAFHRFTEIVLSVGALLMSVVCLLAVMRLADWSWNLLNLMAVPLILGTGVDYSIFMQSALRRHHGDLRMAYIAVGRALLLCGGTAIAGFGSLAWSSNGGMASLGRVCAVGIAGNMLLAVFLLPAWWRRATHQVTAPSPVRTPELKSNPEE